MSRGGAGSSGLSSHEAGQGAQGGSRGQSQQREVMPEGGGAPSPSEHHPSSGRGPPMDNVGGAKEEEGKHGTGIGPSAPRHSDQGGVPLLRVDSRFRSLPSADDRPATFALSFRLTGRSG